MHIVVVGKVAKRGIKRDKTDLEIDEELQVVKRGDVHCIQCNKDFENTCKLKKHVELYNIMLGNL